MNIYSILDLPDRTGELVANVVEGKLSLVMQDGKPLFLAVPFDECLLRHGLSAALAARLFDRGVASLEQCARLAGMSITDFNDLLGAQRIAVTAYAPGCHELDSDALY